MMARSTLYVRPVGCFGVDVVEASCRVLRVLRANHWSCLLKGTCKLHSVYIQPSSPDLPITVCHNNTGLGRRVYQVDIEQPAHQVHDDAVRPALQVIRETDHRGHPHRAQYRLSQCRSTRALLSQERVCFAPAAYWRARKMPTACASRHQLDTGGRVTQLDMKRCFLT